MTIHDFDERLAWSHLADGAPFWPTVYKLAFGSDITMVSHLKHGEHQRDGIDRSITLPNTKQILVDEKIRAKDYGDILLEVVHQPHDRSKEPWRGWAERDDLRCDYIAYAVLPLQTAFLLPIQQLRRAYVTFGDEWKDAARANRHGENGTDFRCIEARNKKYTTWSICVPRKVLFAAMTDTLTVRWATD